MIFKYNIKIDRHCIQDYHDGQKYGEWKSEYINSFHSITRVKNEDYGDIESSLDLKEGDKCWVVWVEYSSGDSFGQGVRNDVAECGVFISEEAALELKNAIENFHSETFGSLNLTTSDGQKHCMYPIWTGYFEHLDEVHVDLACVREKEQ